MAQNVLLNVGDKNKQVPKKRLILKTDIELKTKHYTHPDK